MSLVQKCLLVLAFLLITPHLAIAGKGRSGEQSACEMQGMADQNGNTCLGGRCLFYTCPVGYDKKDNCCEKRLTNQDRRLKCQEDNNAFPDCNRLLLSQTNSDEDDGEQSTQVARAMTQDELDCLNGAKSCPQIRAHGDDGEEKTEATQTAGAEGALEIPPDQG